MRERERILYSDLTEIIQVFTAMYYHQAYKMVTMVRGALVTSIYTKTVDLSIT